MKTNKNHLVSFFLAVSTLACLNASAQIPNGDFEHWSTVPDQFVGPNGWTVNNSQPDQIDLVQPGDPHLGSFSARVMRKWDPFQNALCSGITSTEFPYAQRPTFLNGFIKTGMQPGDSASIGVYFQQAGAAIGGGNSYFKGTNGGFAPFSIPINYINGSNPDTVSIIISNGLNWFTSSPQIPNDTISVDDLVFDFGVGIPDKEVENAFVIYPNPVKDYFVVESLSLQQHSTLEIFNELGENVYTCLLVSDRQTIKNTLSKGIYLVKVSDGKKESTQKLIVE